MISVTLGLVGIQPVQAVVYTGQPDPVTVAFVVDFDTAGSAAASRSYVALSPAYAFASHQLVLAQEQGVEQYLLNQKVKN